MIEYDCLVRQPWLMVIFSLIKNISKMEHRLLLPRCGIVPGAFSWIVEIVVVMASRVCSLSFGSSWCLHRRAQPFNRI